MIGYANAVSNFRRLQINIETPNNFECMWSLTSFRILCAVYIPYTRNVAICRSISSYIIVSFDYLSVTYQCCNLFLCGDFNRMNVIDIINNIDIIQIVNENTRE